MKKNYFQKTFIKEFLRNLKFMSDNLFGVYYIYKGKSIENKGDKEQAYLVYLRGISRFPLNFLLNRNLAELEMLNRSWSESVQYWNVLFKFDRFLKQNDYLKFSEALQNNDQLEKSFNILVKGNAKFPKFTPIINKLAHICLERNNWDLAVKLFKEFIELSKETPSFHDYIALFQGYKNLKKISEAMGLLNEIKIIYPNKSNEIRQLLISLLVENKDWSSAISEIKNLKYRNAKDDLENLIKLSMLYKVIGDFKNAKATFDNLLENHKDTLKKDEKGYRKLIVYDNGESRIEFYKTLKNTDSLMITFDSINMEWQNPSFAFKLLMRQDLDIIAIRKREKKTYQQDLQQQDFLNVVEPMIKGYRDKMAYGFSLGAYNALYFASLINCRILAFSPRLSIHPKFGRTKIIPKYTMKHNLSLPYNKDIEPIIVYDPKNALDNKYIKGGVLPFFPNAKLIKIPYGGHGIAPHLLKMGVLKKYVISFINNKTPYYDRKLKIKSNIYFRNLGSECLKHNKLKWALNLAEISLGMLSSDLNAIKLKLKALKRLNKYQEVCEFAKYSIGLVPNNLDLRLYLIDAYIELNQFENAKNEIKYVTKSFGQKKNVLKRQKILNEKLKQYHSLS